MPLGNAAGYDGESGAKLMVIGNGWYYFTESRVKGIKN
jgi:hypothetical protein